MLTNAATRLKVYFELIILWFKKFIELTNWERSMFLGMQLFT